MTSSRGPIRRTSQELRELIEAQPRDPDTGCWEWSGALSSGYGVLCRNGRRGRAHRVSYAVFREEPGELFVCHHCDNRKCCNPEHLFLGTQKDNIVDAHNKGRIVSPSFRGEAHGRARLTEEDVREIRHMYATGAGSQQRIADGFGVAQTTVSSIVRGVRWSHVK